VKRPNSGNRENCKLVDDAGKLIMRLTYTEARSMAERNKCEHVRGGTYRLFVQPSNSPDSCPMLTQADTRRYIDYVTSGEKLTESQFERLTGWGLIKTSVTAFGSVALAGV